MNDGSGPIGLPARVAAGVLGGSLLVGGAAFLVAGVLMLPRGVLVVFAGVAACVFGLVFARACWTGMSPRWPD
jgi:hypothetical protein